MNIIIRNIGNLMLYSYNIILVYGVRYMLISTKWPMLMANYLKTLFKINCCHQKKKKYLYNVAVYIKEAFALRIVSYFVHLLFLFLKFVL